MAEARDAALRCRKLRLEGIDPIEANKQQRAVARLDDAKSISFAKCAGTAPNKTITLDLTHPDAVVINWLPASPLTSLEFIERYGGLTPVLILTGHNVLIVTCSPTYPHS